MDARHQDVLDNLMRLLRGDTDLPSVMQEAVMVMARARSALRG
jgi:hypothetical protein